MSVRNLDLLFAPRSIALIGATRTPGTPGQILARRLFNAGFDGPILPVSQDGHAIEGVLAYPSVEALPLAPDLAVIASAPELMPGLIAELGARGTRVAIVASAGFAELGEEGQRLQQAMLEAARPYTLRIVGPNCRGVMAPGHGLDAGFLQDRPQAGEIAFVSQSGAVLSAVVEWANARRIGFSHMVSLGAMADVDVGDLLDHFATDRYARAILLYVEAITHARKFMSAARAAGRSKPVVVIKAGRSGEAARAAQSHTGALAGSDAVHDAAFCRAGLLRVETLDELFAAVETLRSGTRVAGERMAIVSNGGGPGLLATDGLIRAGGRLAALAPEALARLDGLLPAAWCRANPVDLGGDAPGALYGEALDAVLADPGSDAALVLCSPSAVADGTEAAEATVAAAARHRRPVLTCWLGEASAAGARALFAKERVPTYATPEEAVRGFMHLVRYRRNQEMLREVPPSIPEEFEPEAARAQDIIDHAMAEGRDWLTEPEAKAVLAAYGVPSVPTHVVSTPEEAAAAATAIGRPVALKILSAEILHKSDVGGVMLGLAGAHQVRDAARTMLANVAAARPHARIEGLTVQPMAEGADAFELIVGMSDDLLFGPVILFGEGGDAAEIVRDRALALPPLNLVLARELMRATRIHTLLQGYRSHPPAALDEIALTLVKVSQMVIDLDRIAELDINPLRADPRGVIALDARIRVARPTRRGPARLAIRPYPKELEQELALRDGRRLLVRPIRPEDGPAMAWMVERGTTAEDRRLRFFSTMRTISPELCARLTQIDYDREMALAAVDPASPVEEALCGVVRIAADPDRERAEYAILVRSDRKGQGLGNALMTAIIDYARGQGIGEIFGTVLQENRAMLALAERLGFERQRHDDDLDVVTVRLPLRPAA